MPKTKNISAALIEEGDLLYNPDGPDALVVAVYYSIYDAGRFIHVSSTPPPVK